MQTANEDELLEYLAEILVEAFLEEKGYTSTYWLNGEKKWKKPDNLVKVISKEGEGDIVPSTGV